MPSETFLARNPNYRGIDRSNQPRKSGPEKIHGFSGLDQFYAMQDRRRPAFPDPRRPGTSAVEIAKQAAQDQVMLGPNGTLVADTLNNRVNPNRFGPPSTQT